ncbi:FAD-dependent oxidoreductase [Victivallis vadensis]|uniref:FAD-dependent oxidoreductase n=1 Tax=Victivallis vadensis TaxID=172901 RepID=A0A848B4J0_9BACT|nr:FAD-dependent oxidoreductase [Victivallis vadensis]NMD87982.1 FAD-dependent oxidoreductase [Victivallis vadensis]PWM71195.1 MAG: hypothetical protein DBX90_16245 [Lentisphaerota bacterium]
MKTYYDIAVIGGGVAGVAAAVQAARCGMKTVLVERTALVGGLATGGLINVFLPLCDGNGHQVTFGIAEEMLRKSIVYGPGEIPPNWKKERNGMERKRFIAVFSPASFVLALDEMLDEAGVDVWLDSLVCDVRIENEMAARLEIENESGRIELSAKRFIDASGSAVLARRLGQNVVTDDNYFSSWTLEFKSGAPYMNYGPIYGNGVPTGIFSDDDLRSAGTSLAELREAKRHGITGKQVSEYLRVTRRCLRSYYAYAYDSGKSDRNSLYPLKLPIMPQYRKICAIQAAETMRDGQANRHVPDSVGLVADWRRAGSVWEVPFRSLYSASGPENLLFAGRCMGAVGDAWEVMRVIPAAAVTGQAAGMAAALALRDRLPLRELSVERLGDELKRRGIPRHLEELGLTEPCRKER